MEIHEQRRTFRTLDGLRGVAALVVVTRHLGPMGLQLPNTFLAVDLFFLLSGYVVAHAYDRRLAAGGFFGRFLLIRLIRLYPLYLLGIAIGTAAHYGGKIGLAPGALVEATIIGALMIPANPLLAFGCSALDGPVWTLPLELFANLVYAALFPLFGTFALTAIVGVTGAGILAWAQAGGQLDAGWAFADLPVALARLGFSFFSGVLMFRLSRGRDRGGVRPLPAWGCLAMLVLLLIVPVPEPLRLLYQQLLILVAFRILVWTASVCEPDAHSGRLFRFLGLISYAVYTMHQPLGFLTKRLLDHAAQPDWHAIHRLTTILFTAALIPICWAADEFYDAPVRRWLGRHLLGQR